MLLQLPTLPESLDHSASTCEKNKLNMALTFTVLPGLGGERCIESWISHDIYIYTNYISYMGLYICIYYMHCVLFFAGEYFEQGRKNGSWPGVHNKAVYKVLLAVKR